MRCRRSAWSGRTRRRGCRRTYGHRSRPGSRGDTGACGGSWRRRSGRSRRRRCRLRSGSCRTGLDHRSAHHFRRRLLRRRRFCYLLCFRRLFRCGQITKMLTDALRVHQIDRTRMRLFFGDASFWEVLDQDLGLDLEFSSQFINPDLIGICHSPLVSTATSYLGTAASCHANNLNRIATACLFLQRTRQFRLRGLLR